jgi:uracil-DNA glycosylase
VKALAEISDLEKLKDEVSNCRICIDPAVKNPLPHEPRPVLIVSSNARIAICGQAPGTRVHQSGIPFTDPSGDRLRQWLGVDDDDFYDSNQFAIIPMGFCFPGLDAKGGDLPPRKECALAWRSKVMEMMPQLKLLLVIGIHAQAWHMGKKRKKNLTDTVAQWRSYLEEEDDPAILPLPHPSWRNNAWIKKNLWFEEELLPVLKARVKIELKAAST